MKQRQRVLKSPIGFNSKGLSEAESQHLIYEEDEPRRPVRAGRPPININSNDCRVDIPEFEGKLDSEEFLDWLSTIERVFKYKEVSKDKKVKLLSLIHI